MRSRIFPKERTVNQDRLFGSNLSYIPCRVVEGGKIQTALFTDDQIAVALKRAQDNPEDVPPLRVRERIAIFIARVRGT